MKDITKIDWQGDYTKLKEGDPAKMAKQKVFFIQDGIEYGPDGVACNGPQVKKHYQAVAAEAQKSADEAKDAAAAAQVAADEMLKTAGINKTAARKAV